jgi:hypothetical protein
MNFYEIPDWPRGLKPEEIKSWLRSHFADHRLEGNRISPEGVEYAPLDLDRLALFIDHYTRKGI